MPWLSQPLKKCLIMQSNGAHIHDTHFFTKENWNFRRVLFLRVEVWVFRNGKNWCFMLLACHACMGHDLMAKWIQIILIMPSNSFICIQFTFPRSYIRPTYFVQWTPKTVQWTVFGNDQTVQVQLYFFHAWRYMLLFVHAHGTHTMQSLTEK